MQSYDSFYDPMIAPDPDEWLSLDEIERIDQVIECHRDLDVDLPNEKLHATIHVIVENQIAMDVDPVPKTLDRLVREGLDRHEAIHAIGSVLASQLHELLFADELRPAKFQEEKFSQRLNKLTAKRWLKGKW